MRCMTFDGGGFRGLLSAALASQLEMRCRGEIGKSLFDGQVAYAGTSVGAIIAAALAVGMKPTQIVSLIGEHGKEIFKRTWWDKISDPLWLRNAKYPNAHLRKTLLQYFGTITFNQLKRPLLITSFDLDNDEVGHYKPVVFHNFGDHPKYGNLTLVEACLRSAAAPTFFPHNGFIDGAVWGNHPGPATFSALVNKDLLDIDLDEIKMISFGTGFSKNRVPHKRGNWGFLEWISKGELINILLGDATVGSLHYYCKSCLGDRYHRLQPHFSDCIAMDDPSKKQKLLTEARTYNLRPTMEWILKHWF